MPGLWRYQGDGHGNSDKYLVVRRDGTVFEHPNFTLGARDPAAPAALRAYADECQKLDLDPQYVEDLKRLADEFEEYRKTAGNGDPDASRHRQDDRRVVHAMRTGKLALSKECPHCNGDEHLQPCPACGAGMLPKK